MWFLLTYDRAAGQLLDERVFDDSREALAARFVVEKQYRRHGNIEVVAIGAPSREALMRSHGRYFFTLGQLTERLSQLVR